MRKLSQEELDVLDRVERLPDCAAVSIRICALMTGTSERTWRRSPPIPTFFVSPGKRAANVGLLRKLSRGELASSTAA